VTSNEDQAVLFIRRLIREAGLAAAMQAVPYLGQLLEAPTDSALEAAERAIAEAAQAQRNTPRG
jgi:hypothetical protein